MHIHNLTTPIQNQKLGHWPSGKHSATSFVRQLQNNIPDTQYEICNRHFPFRHFLFPLHCMCITNRPKLRYSDHMKSVLRQCNIPVSDLEQLAEDRELWSLTCASDLKNLTAASEQAASDRRARRHAATAATPAGPVCPLCGRTCASTSVSTVIFVSTYDRTTLHQYNVIVDIDGLPQASKHIVWRLELYF